MGIVNPDRSLIWAIIDYNIVKKKKKKTETREEKKVLF